MRNRPMLVVCAILVGGWLASQFASPLRGQNAAESTADASAQQRDLHTAEAYLKLMEATLGKFEEMNQRQPNIVRPTVIQAIQDAVTKARESVRLAKSDQPHSDARILLMRTETDLRLTEDNLRRAEAANQRFANTVSPGEITRLLAERDFARAKLERARSLGSEDPLASIQFELDRLREDVQELRLAVALLRAGRG